jgi:drug/metabolite transporter (DMT)-like permease
VTQRDLLRVILWMTGALLSFSAMAVSVRGLAKVLHVFEILAIRNASGLVILLAIGLAQPDLLRTLTLHRARLQLARNTIHFGAQYLWMLSVTLLPLATVFALEFTMPAYAAILAVVFLGEKVTAGRIGVVVLGFLGVLVILRPGIASFNPAALFVLTAAFGFAVSLIQTKALTTSETTYAIVLWMNAVQLPLALMGSEPKNFLNLGAAQALPLIGVAISGLTSHFCLTQAFRSGDATVVVPLDFLRIPLIAVVGWMFYGESLDGFVFAGAGLIICGILWNLLAESRRSGTPVAASTEKAQSAEP